MSFDIYSFEKFKARFHIQSPKKKEKKYISISAETINNILKCICSFFLLSINFLLFAGSGYFRIFDNNFFSVEVLNVILILIIGLSLLFWLSRKSSTFQNLIVSFFIFLFISALYNQFAQFDYQGFLQNYLGNFAIFEKYSDVLIALLLAGICYWILSKNNMYYILYFDFLLSLVFFNILYNQFSKNNNIGEFIVNFDNQEVAYNNRQDSQKVIHIFLPNLSSYQYIKEWKDIPLSEETKNLILAFYAKNNFVVYPNAYTTEKNSLLNFARILNSQHNDDINNYLMKTKILYKYWNFLNLREDYIFLKNNDLFETYKNSGYNINAYNAYGIDLCHVHHNLNVNRCTDKIITPISIYSPNISSFEKTKIVFTEWLSSTKLLDNVKIDVRKHLNVGNFYVVNSVHTLDRLYEDIINDHGSQAYFVFLGLPAELYIYDQYCQIKQPDQWLSKKYEVSKDIIETKDNREAYLEQLRCTYGKLEQFMRKIETLNSKMNFSIFIQSLSSYEQNPSLSRSFVDDFIARKLVTVAYKNNSKSTFEIKSNICSIYDIMNYILYGSQMCDNLDGINAHIILKNEIQTRLMSSDTKLNDKNQLIKDFDAWYDLWNKNYSENNS